MSRKLCVIGPNCGKAVGQYDRTWFDDIQGAVDHATDLATRSYRDGGKPRQLLVVEVVKVVEIGMPQVTVRDPGERIA